MTATSGPAPSAPTPSLPTPAPHLELDTAGYWTATAEGRLVLAQCQECDRVIWYPRGFCPACGSLRTTWVEASGRGTIYTFTVIAKGTGPYAAVGPYVLAYVELEEGPCVMTNIVDADPTSLRIDQAVTAVFHDTGQGTALVRFRPS